MFLYNTAENKVVFLNQFYKPAFVYGSYLKVIKENIFTLIGSFITNASHKDITVTAVEIRSKSPIG